MARFCDLFFSRTTVFIGLLFVVVPLAKAQITNIGDDTSTPIEGAGHDYFHMLSETVNPANGSVSLRIEVPIPKGRGLTVPFSIDYDSNGVSHLEATLPGAATWQSNTGYLSQGGWSYSVPMVSAVDAPVTAGNPPNTFTCQQFSNYMFLDPWGGQHALRLGTQISNQGDCPGDGTGIQSSGDSQVFGFLPATTPFITDPFSNPFAPVTVWTADGTVYNFPTLSHSIATSSVIAGLPSTIEDRNGNEITVADNNNGNFTFTDTLGRPVLSSDGFGGPINFLTFPGGGYKLVWDNASPVQTSFTPPSQWVGSDSQDSQFDFCTTFPSAIEPQTVITAIVLPDNSTVQFHYGSDNANPTFKNSYGLLNEIDYPNGAWVKYHWDIPGLNELADYPGSVQVACNVGGSADPFCTEPVRDGCLFLYGTPVVTIRQSSSGGASPSLTQQFSYTTNWNGTAWSTKATNVVTTDDVTGQSAVTHYTYSFFLAPTMPFDFSKIAGQIPVEQQIQYSDGNSHLLRTVNKTWFNIFDLKSEQTILNDNPNSPTSLTTYCYVGTNCVPNSALPQLQEKDEYDYGATVPRKTVTTYQNFAGTLGVINNAPCKTVVYDKTNSLAAETDYLYDGGTTVCGTAGVPSVSGAGGTSLTNHDETKFSPGSGTPRGNLTTKIQVLNSGTSPSTTYTYDETGQVTSMKDPNGNITQYSYQDSFVNTNTSSMTTTAGNPPAGQVTNAYLTQVTQPSTNGIAHIEKYSYGYNDGQLTVSTDQNLQTTTYRYDDAFSRPTEIDTPDGGTATNAYGDGIPPTLETIQKLNSQTSLTNITIYDGLGHIVETDSSDSEGPDFVDSTYNGMGLLISRSNPRRPSTPGLSTDGVTNYVYDALGRTCLVIPPGGTLVSSCPATAPANDISTSYSGNCTTVTDSAGKSRTSCSDVFGNLTNVWEDPNGMDYETDYQYDGLNNLLSVTQKGGSSPDNWRTRTFTYDSLSRLRSATNPESGTVNYGYDPNGNLTQKTDARGVVTFMTYDALNRVLMKSYSDGTPAAIFYYDVAPAPWANNEQNTNGRLVEETTGITPEP